MEKLLKFFNRDLLFYLVAFLILFIPLYPKLPAIGVRNTWVYIRLEDFFIAGTALLFLFKFIRKKASLNLALGIPIFLYWIIGAISLIASFIFVAPHLANFFPHVAVLSYLRRIEYMILFFIGYTVIKKKKDMEVLFWTLTIACVVILLYGLGQRYYINIWAAFPAFFQKFSFCFPSFQTTNEEFAKGIPLCLPEDGRITSLFGGHYDLSAYLVFVIPLIFSVVFAVKSIIKKIYLTVLGFGLVYLLILTSSRISFLGYIIAVIFALTFIKKKWFLVPVLIVSMFFLFTSSASVLQRFTQTLRFTNLVFNSNGQVVGEAVNTLPDDLKNKISKEPLIVDAPPPTQELPKGSSYIQLPGEGTATSSAVLKRSPNLSLQEKGRYKFGAVEISNETGNFLIKRALVYDISFTTRFQGEWPVSWGAFMRDPAFGSGYATITLSSDNSFLRALGETGALGFLSFFSFFLIWYVYVKNNKKELNLFEKNFIFGLSAGIIGLSINAILIDVFEASKVAESMWLILGIGAGGIALVAKEKIHYMAEIKKVLTSQVFILIYLLLLFFVFLSNSFTNYFVGDDFTWLYWAAKSEMSTLLFNFVNAQGFFFRPIDKLVIFGLYTLFSVNPIPYHIFNLFINFGVSVGVYFILYIIFKKKKMAFLGTLIFSFIPSHSQDLFWIATISTTLSSLFVLLGLLCFYFGRIKNSLANYMLSFVFFTLAVFSYENAVIFIGLVYLFDFFFIRPKHKTNKARIYFPYIINALIIGVYLLIRSQAGAAGFSGDYNYNLAKVIPNSIGNYFGYVLMFFTGENSLSFYNLLRDSLKSYTLIITVIGFLFMAFCSGFILEHKEKIKVSKNIRIFIFGFLFTVVSLLPYLPLGNITLRYLYLPSVGFVVILTVILENLLSRAVQKKFENYAYAVALIIIAAFCFVGLQMAENYWDQASRITYDTLARLRIEYDIKNQTNVYFYNVPTKIGEAYIFPVGLPDAIYFVNSDKTVHTYIVKDKNEALTLQKNIPSDVLHTYIFMFDDKMFLHKISETYK